MRPFRWLLALVPFGFLTLGGCATLGHDFPADTAMSIKLDQTTRADIEKQLGPPFRTGLDSGDPTATYLYYHLGLFSDPVTKDLTITYTPQGKVKSYTYNSNLGAQDAGKDKDPLD
jgi:hypothetical protein